MTMIYIWGIITAGYLIGSIPFGYLIVKLNKKRDLREIQSGRTGGTNVMRAAGLWAGLATAALDFIKGASAVWLGKIYFPEIFWLHVLTGLATILGHNYSIFLMDRNENGRIKLHGGAGGATTTGVSFAFWPPAAIISIPIGGLILFGLGYASIATMSIPIILLAIFIIRAWMGLSPWPYVYYGLLSEIILIWALRPNIKRLINGSERIVGWRARKKS